jgi:AbrB family looped-hinge helix DNA binding protein
MMVSNGGFMVEGKVSSKYQLTLPVEVRKALGIKPGDTVRYQVEAGKLAVSMVRPDIDQILEDFLASHDLSALHEEIAGDAVRYVRQLRGWEEDDER